MVLVGLLMAASPAHAQRVEAYLSADSVTVGDRFTLTLVALHGFETAPSFPDAGEAVYGDLEVLGVTASGGRALGDSGTRLDSVVYEATTFALDTAYVPALSIVFSGTADTFSIASSPLILPVSSLVPPEAAPRHPESAQLDDDVGLGRHPGYRALPPLKHPLALAGVRAEAK